jgi:hypothetical protein
MAKSPINRTKQYFLTVLLGISMALNLLAWVDWSNAPEYKIGTLKKDVEVSVVFSSVEKQVIVLPKGLAVRNATPRGLARISLIAPYRFSIYIADGEDDLVDYLQEPKMDELYFTQRTSTGKF